MKQILKFKKSWITLIVLLLFALNTEAAFEKRENRLDKKGESKGLENNSINKFTSPEKGPANSGGIGLGGDPNGEDPIGGSGSPIGDAFPLLIGFGLVYGIYVFSQKGKESIE